MPNQDTTVRFKADISNLKASMQEAGRLARLAKSEFEAASAGMGKWSANADGLSAKLTQLNKQEQIQERLLKALEAEYKNVAESEGAASKGAQELEIKINKQKAALAKTQSDIAHYSEKLEELNKAGEIEELSGVEKQRKSIHEMETELDKLKSAYASLQLEEEDTSEESERLAREISQLSGELKDAKTDLSNAEKAADDLDQSLEEVDDSAEKAGDGFTVMKGALANLVADGVRAAIDGFKNLAKSTFEVGTNFESSMSNVAALSGATGEELQKLENTAKEFGSSTVFSASEAADALGYMALAGWDAEQSTAALGGVLNLAAASGMDLAQASDMITDYLSAFGMEAKDAGKLADELAYAQANSNTTTEQLGEAFKNSAANLNAAGQDVETVTSLLAAMANQGLKGSEAGTALTAIMRDLTAKMKDGQITIGDTSIAVQDANGNYRDLTDILKDVDAATQGMGNAEKAAALKTTFTKDSIKGLNLILNDGVGKAAKFEESLRQSGGAAADMAETMNDNVSGSLKLLKSNIEDKMLKVFDAAAPRIKKAIDSLSRALDGLNWDAISDKVADFAETLGQVFEFILTHSGQIKTALETVGTVIATVFIADKISAFKTAVLNVVPALVGLTGATDAATVATELLAVAQAALPFVAIAAGALAVVGALDAYNKQQERAIRDQYKFTEEEQKYIDAASASKKQLEESTKARKEAIGKINSEANYLSGLRDEYNSLIDSNGKVKKGYEDRAEFILTTLANALGVERSEIDKNIGKNGKLKKSITDLIEVQRAQAMLDANKDAYQEAYQNREKEQQTYIKNLETLDKKQAEYNETRQAAARVEEKHSQLVKDNVLEAARYINSQNDVIVANDAAKKKYDEAAQAVKNSEETLDSYNRTIKDQETLSSAVMSGNTKKIQKAMQQQQFAYETAEQGTVESLEKQANDYKDYYYKLLAISKDGSGRVTKADLAAAKYRMEATRKEVEKAKGSAAKAYKNVGDAEAKALASTAPAHKKAAQKNKKSTLEGGKDKGEFNKQGKGEGQSKARGIASTAPAHKKAGQKNKKAALQGAEAKREMGKEGAQGGKAYASKMGAQSGASKGAGGKLKKSAVSSSNAKGEMGRQGSSGGGAYASGISSKKGAAGSAGGLLARTAISNMKGDSYGVGVNFGQGFVNGVKSKAGAAASAATSVALSAVNAFKKSLDLNSPSKVTYQIGVYFTQGFMNGIASMQKTLVKTVKDMVQSVVTEMSKMSNYNFNVVGQNASELFANAFSDKANYFINKITYQNEKKIKEFESDIAKVEAANNRKNANLQAKSNAQVKRIEAKRDAELRQIEKNRNSEIKKIENQRNADIKAVEKKRDAIIAANEKARDQKVKALERKRQKAKKQSDKNRISQQIKAVKESTKKANAQEKKNAKAEIDRIKANAKNQIDNIKETSKEKVRLTKADYKKQIDLEKANVKKLIAANNAATKKLVGNYNKAKEAYQTASGEFLSEFSGAMSEYQTKAQALIDDTINGITERYTERYNDLISKQENLIQKMQDAGDLFEISGAGVMTVNDLTAQTKAINDYAKNLEKIKGKVSAELFEQITSYDMTEGSAFISRLLSMSTKDLEAYNKAYTEKMKAAQTAGEKIYKADFDKVATDYKKEVNSAFKNLPKQLEDLGVSAMKGFVNGLTKNTDYMDARVKTFVKAMVNSFKKQLNIKSPSKVMLEIGEYTGEGFTNGLLNSVKAVQDAVSLISDSVSTPLNGMGDNINLARSIGAIANGGNSAVSNNNVVNNYNLVQNNNSPKPLTALETYQARRRQVAMVKALTQ